MQGIKALTVALLLTIVLNDTAHAQTTTAPRLRSNNGAWLLPVAGDVLCSDEHRHIGRGSVRAWDLCVPYGSATYPIADGVVEYAGCSNAGGYGCWLYINHGNGFKAIYAHQIEGSITVRTGDSVRQNQQIGRVGWTGMTSFGPHVHLEIHHASAPTGRVMIGDYFTAAMLKDCPLCSVSGAAVVASGSIGGSTYHSNQAPGDGFSSLWLFLAGAAIMALIVGWFYSPDNWLWFSLWHGGSVAAVLLLFVFLPMGTIPASADNEALEIAYRFTVGAEGWQCTHDPVRTFGGITQGTYDAWRMAQGMGPADVCGSLTEIQRRQIFTQHYWVDSGANRLPAKLAVTYADHVFNTGSAGKGLAACGANVECFNDWRVYDYSTKSNCALYCNAWVNRVNRVRGITER